MRKAKLRLEALDERAVPDATNPVPPPDGGTGQTPNSLGYTTDYLGQDDDGNDQYVTTTSDGSRWLQVVAPETGDGTATLLVAGNSPQTDQGPPATDIANFYPVPGKPTRYWVPDPGWPDGGYWKYVNPSSPDGAVRPPGSQPGMPGYQPGWTGRLSPDGQFNEFYPPGWGTTPNPNVPAPLPPPPRPAPRPREQPQPGGLGDPQPPVPPRIDPTVPPGPRPTPPGPIQPGGSMVVPNEYGGTTTYYWDGAVLQTGGGVVIYWYPDGSSTVNGPGGSVRNHPAPVANPVN